MILVSRDSLAHMVFNRSHDDAGGLRARSPTSPPPSALHELHERAVLAVGLALLDDGGQPLLVELRKPLVPADVLKLLLAGAAGEVDPQDAGILLRVGIQPRR
jgi:hypothetical protein